MTTITNYLDRITAPRQATPVTDPAEAERLVQAFHDDQDQDNDGHLGGFISERGRVVAHKLPKGERLLYASAITLDDDYAWEDLGPPTVYRCTTDDQVDIRVDALRVFLGQSIDNDATREFAGWRDRIVALIPEEVGLKEAKIIWTDASGNINATHTYNVMDAIATYARHVNALADEFGTNDDRAEGPGPNLDGVSPFTRQIVQAWLLKNAAECQLEQARFQLKFALASQSQQQELNVSELARSLHTDRSNLHKAVKAAQVDRQVTRLMSRIEGRSSIH